MSIVRSSLVTPLICGGNGGGGGPLVWTYGFDGTDAIGTLTNEWVPTGTDYYVRVDFVTPDDASGAESLTLISGATFLDMFYLFADYVAMSFQGVGGGGYNTGAFSIAYGSKHSVELFALAGTADVDGVQTTIGISDGTGLTVKTIGVNDEPADYFRGQIHRIELIDNDTPSNSIIIDMLIESETKPTDGTIYNAVDNSPIGFLTGGSFELALFAQN